MKSMKNILYLSLFLGVLMLGSCLDQKPLTSHSKDSIYGNEKGLRSALAACYAQINAYQYRGGLGMFEMANNSLIFSKIDAKFSVTGANSHQNNEEAYFAYPYKVISYCNALLSFVNRNTVPAAVVAEITGEASLVRAIAYFDVVRSVGRCQLKMEPIEGDFDRIHTPRSSLKDVYNFILSDLRYAEQNMVDRAHKQSWHPSRSAATALKAKVFMYMASLTQDHFAACKDDKREAFYDDYLKGDIEGARRILWDSCYVNAQKVYQCGDYQLNATHAEMFNNKSKNTREGIIEFQSNATYGATFSITRTTLNRPSGVGDAAYSPYAPNAFKLSQYERVQVSKATFSEHFKKYGNGKLLVSGVASEAISSNQERGCDPRINTNYLYFSNFRAGYSSSGDYLYYPNRAYRIDYGTMYPCVRKYYYDEFRGDRTDCNLIYLRLADVILIMAEAANELGRADEAISLINTTILARARAGNTDTDKDGNIQPADWSMSLNQEQVRTAIMLERSFELLCENADENFDPRRKGVEVFREYFDRYNKWLARYYMPLDQEGWAKDPVKNVRHASEPYYTDEWLSAEFMRKNLFFPIPSSEMGYNTAIKPTDQNMGW